MTELSKHFIFNLAHINYALNFYALYFLMAKINRRV